jgi:hypothetical protein
MLGRRLRIKTQIADPGCSPFDRHPGAIMSPERSPLHYPKDGFQSIQKKYKEPEAPKEPPRSGLRKRNSSNRSPQIANLCSSPPPPSPGKTRVPPEYQSIPWLTNKKLALRGNTTISAANFSSCAKRRLQLKNAWANIERLYGTIGSITREQIQYGALI